MFINLINMLNNLIKDLLNSIGVQKPTKRGVTENP